MMPCLCKPRRARRKDARPQELLAAALDLFVEFGYAATRLDDVAQAAGVSKGTLYLYFSSKEELFKAVVRENVGPLLGEAEHLIAQFEGNTQDLFRLVMRSWWHKMGETKLSGLPKLMMAEAANFPELARFYQEEIIVRGEQLVASILARGMQLGEIRSVDLEIHARLLTAPIIMMMIWKHSRYTQIHADSWHDYLEHYIDIALYGVTHSAHAERQQASSGLDCCVN